MATVSLTPDIAPLSAASFDLDQHTQLLPTTVTRTNLPTRVQASYTTRYVSAAVDECPANFHLISGQNVVPRSGDVVIARVKEILNHKRVETPESRKAILFEGALIMLAYGNRYAADQFLAHVPNSLETCHLVAAGGIAGTVTQSHEKMDDPTVIEPVGLLANQHGVVNISQFAPYETPHQLDVLPDSLTPRRRPEVIAVLGTAMNSGKSTTMACLINGLTQSGRRVSAGKITGTGAGNVIPGTAENVLFGEISYQHPRGWFGSVDVLYTDEQFANNANTAVNDNYTLSNVRFGYELETGSLLVTPFISVNNLFDETYNGNVRINAFGGRFFEPAPGRNAFAGVSLNYSY